MRRKEVVTRYIIGSPAEVKVHLLASRYGSAYPRKPRKHKDKNILVTENVLSDIKEVKG
jgi:hypothetical protein